MNLELFFSPLEENALQLNTDDTLFEMSNVFIEKMPEWKHADAVLLSIHDNKEVYEIRKLLYSFKQSTIPFQLVDLGALRPGPTQEETINRLKEVCQFFYECKKPLIILDNDQCYTKGQFLGYENTEELLSMLNIDAVIDMDPLGDENHTFLNDVILHDPNYLFHYVQLGYQSYLNSPAQMGHMEKLNFEMVRLGEVKHDIKEMEPLVRATNFTSFDVSTIKSQDAPGVKDSRPFGLTGEEACQLSWYAGTNENMYSFGIYGFNLEKDVHHQTAFIIATMVWYFIDGVMHRKKKKAFSSSDFTRYVVAMSSNPEELIFYKQRATEKWWMEVGYKDRKSKKQKVFYVPCSYKDYKHANANELPDLWVKTLAKLI